ncbi:MAG TPA: glycosyltransferase [Caulobacteraceae bacterium]|nr:glycosyltransferase [Caulobacteraceae bacterium]
MKLFQYWDTGSPPDEVAGLIESVRALNRDLDYGLYDRDDAAWFIRKHFGARELRAFEACAAPAMQSDYFRLCVLKRKGGFYIDTDMRCVAPLADLIASCPGGLLSTLYAHLVNNPWLSPTKNDPFVSACLQLATANITDEAAPSVYTATGPGVLDAIRLVVHPESAPRILAALDNPVQRQWGFPMVLERARRIIEPTPALRDSFDTIRLLGPGRLGSWLSPAEPAYKTTSIHWMNWEGSIYRPAPMQDQT